MTTRLSKTEQAILSVLQERGRFTACNAWGHGAQGGCKAGGSREYDAASRLIKRGLAREINRYSERDTRHGWTIHYATLVIGLPNEEEVIKAAEAGDERARATIVRAVSTAPENRTAFQQALAASLCRET